MAATSRAKASGSGSWCKIDAWGMIRVRERALDVCGHDSRAEARGSGAKHAQVGVGHQ
ncbi:hypothetical protein L7F22_007818 [Adiantum nelumboides]|nr:hypothetical protein [Adiantum nelumboides]